MLDANQAFRFARGAMWHLEVALPELAAASGVSKNADDLARVAAAHLDHAAADFASAVTHADTIHGVSDPALGALLVDSARDLRAGTATPGSVADIVRNARLRAQASLDALAPHLTEDEELLALAPAATAPRNELALVDQVADARTFKMNSDLQRAQVRRILSEGTIDPEPVRLVGGYGNGNGQMAMVRVRHPETPHLSVIALHRPPTTQAAQEEFFARLAEHAEADHHFAPAVRRADGSALVLAVPGHQLWDEVHSGQDIANVMSNWYRNSFPLLGEDGARLAGQIDADEAKSLDYIVAQADRNAGSVLGNVERGELRFIDQGMSGRGETHDATKPGMKSHFMGGTPGHGTITAEAATNITSRLDDAALADAHAILGRGPDGDLPDGHLLALRQDASQGFLDAMRARRDQLKTGHFEYEPIDLNANPLAHMDYLHQRDGARPF